MEKYKQGEKRERILGIHEKDTETFFQKLDIFDDLKEKSLRCIYCNRVITLDNFYALSKIKGKFIFVCDNPECRDKVNLHD